VQRRGEQLAPAKVLGLLEHEHGARPVYRRGGTDTFTAQQNVGSFCEHLPGQRRVRNRDHVAETEDRHRHDRPVVPDELVNQRLAADGIGSGIEAAEGGGQAFRPWRAGRAHTPTVLPSPTKVNHDLPPIAHAQGRLLVRWCRANHRHRRQQWNR
jgi:hypothetical protein